MAMASKSREEFFWDLPGNLRWIRGGDVGRILSTAKLIPAAAAYDGTNASEYRA